MDKSQLSHLGTFTTALEIEASSIASLLERGMYCIRQGYHLEGVALFAFVKDKLSSDQMHFASVLDEFIQNHACYLQAQQALLLATKHFVETEISQQKLLIAIEELLPSLSEEINKTPQSHMSAQSSQYQQAYLSSQLSPVLSTALNGKHTSVTSQPSPKSGETLPTLYIACFGRFEVRRMEQVVALCQNRKGQEILRYLVAQPGYRTSIDTLMDVVWPTDPPEVARRKLQVAVSVLRRSLNNGYICDSGGGYILCKDKVYQLNPAVTVRTDVDDFIAYYQAGKQRSESEMISYYERSCQLYTGKFLIEDMYADWSFPRREHLHQIYLTMCRALAKYYTEANCNEEARKWTSAILKEDHCDEEAHRQLMRICIAEGRRSEALRQFQRCEHILAEELGVSPMPETIQLLQTLLTDYPLLNE